MLIIAHAAQHVNGNLLHCPHTIVASRLSRAVTRLEQAAVNAKCVTNVIAAYLARDLHSATAFDECVAAALRTLCAIAQGDAIFRNLANRMQSRKIEHL